MSCMRDGRKKGACVSLLSTHRGELTVRKDVPCMYKHTQANTRMSVQAYFCCVFFLPTILHARSIFFSKQLFGVFVFHYNITRKGMRGNGKRRRGERCSKSQEGGIYVDVGEIQHPPSLSFFYYRGEAEAPTITASSSQVWRVCVLGGLHRRRKRSDWKKEGTVEKKARKWVVEIRNLFVKIIYLKAPQGPSMLFPPYHWMKVQSLENLMEREKKALN